MGKPKARLSQAERTEISDLKMLEAATDLILEVGTQNMTLKEVGERAGFSRGLGSLRFGSKDGLYLRLQRFHRKIWVQKLAEFSADKKGLDALLATIDAIDDVLKSEDRYLKAMYTLWFESIGHKSSFHSHTVRRNNNVRNAVIKLVEEGIASGQISTTVNPAAFSATYISMVTGAIYQWLASPENFDTHQAMQDLKQYTLYILSPKQH